MEKTNKNKLLWFIIVLLIIVIIILILLFFTRFGKIENNFATPTGNVDVFDIDIDLICDCDDESCNIPVIPSLPDFPKNQIVPNVPSLPIFDETGLNLLGKVYVDDVNGDYVYHQQLRIFNNAAFNYTNKIAPGASNTYHFIVHNSTEYGLNYYLKMLEETQYKLNIKYRLKRNDQYILGNDNEWVSASELATESTYLDSGKSDRYSLDWKWFDDDTNDTKAGENMDELYKLKVNLHFEILND